MISNIISVPISSNEADIRQQLAVQTPDTTSRLQTWIWVKSTQRLDWILMFSFVVSGVEYQYHLIEIHEQIKQRHRCKQRHVPCARTRCSSKQVFRLAECNVHRVTLQCSQGNIDIFSLRFFQNAITLNSQQKHSRLKIYEANIVDFSLPSKYLAFSSDFYIFNANLVNGSALM